MADPVLCGSGSKEALMVASPPCLRIANFLLNVYGGQRGTALAEVEAQGVAQVTGADIFKYPKLNLVAE
eukprot:11201344-Lingulodinium_polyedra.AAC.1